MPLCVEIVLGRNSIRAEEIWLLLKDSHPDLLHDSKNVCLYDKPYPVRAIAKAIKRSGKPHFGVSFAEGELDYGAIANNYLESIRINKCVESYEDACRWLRLFLAIDSFRYAYTYDEEYKHWQNAYHPDQYDSAGRNYEGLPMKSNGLPYPLEETIIDTSRNPGRRVLRKGYIEAVASLAWLGKQFWEVTDTRKDEVMAQDWLKCDELPSGVLRVQAADEPFTIADGEQGELQNRLRALLFPIIDEEK